MPQTELFRVAKKMQRANPSFIPIPASVEKKRPLGKWSGNSYLFESDFPKRERWEPNCNLGLLVGDDYIVIDVDNKTPAERSKSKSYSENIGLQYFQELVGENEPLPRTLTCTTPSGGKHYYFSLSGKQGEDLLKNWTTCMTHNDTLIAVDIRVRKGYVMVPPSRKGIKRYMWDTKEEFNVPMAPLPNWILKNILESQRKHPNHFEAQEFSEESASNEKVTNDDVEMFRKSDYFQPCFSIALSMKQHNMYIVTAGKPYQCSICSRQHRNNTNHPFLVRKDGVLRFVSRPGKGFNRIIEKDYKGMYDKFEPKDIKQLVENEDITNRAVSAGLHKRLKDTVFPTAKNNVAGV